MVLASQAFWWPSSTTETPTIFKEVPLTYFRTYTYQPLAGNPMVPFPYLTNGLMADRPDLPLLHGGRYDGLDASFSNLKNVYSSPISPFLPKYQHPLLPSTRKPLTTKPTTTTTTTTTPAPTTTPPTVKEQFYGEFPTYNRRQYFSNYPTYQRQPYPYPNYQNYDNGNTVNYVDRPGSANVPFMSCICPAMGVPKNDNPRGYPYAGQSRSTYNNLNSDGFTDDVQTQELPQESKPVPVVLPKIEEEVRSTSTEIPPFDMNNAPADVARKTEKNSLFSGKTMPL